MIRSEIKAALRDAIRKIFGKVEAPEFSIEVPENPEHGDYATNVALVLAKQLKKPPMEIAHSLAAQLTTKVEVAPPGFINFWVSPATLYKELVTVLKKNDKYGKGERKATKISVEYLDANPTGPVHIGHGRSGFLGDVLSNVLSFFGYRVTREFYVNNAKISGQIKSLGKTALGKGSEYRHAQLLRILKTQRVHTKIKKLKNESEAGFIIARIIQKENEELLKEKARISFDLFFEEEAVYKSGDAERLLGRLKKQGILYEKDGAWWFQAKKFGDAEDRVFVRSTGEPTYIVPDIVYHLDKLVNRKNDLVINIFGADHYGYGPRLLGALKALGIEPARVRILIMQTVRLIKGGKEFKMSKRRGLFVTLEELIKEVGLDAARYFFLEKSPDTHMDFDLDLAKERSVKNPVYYIQYAHARISSIFKNARNSNYKLQITNYKLLKEREELRLIKKLIQFTEIVEDTARDYQVHRLPRYAYELARAFHNFYEKHRVITEDKNLTAARLNLVSATQVVLKNILSLMGIGAPEKM
ncbi:MAG: arginine--tRNA ligase [Candidatus Sungiibacteriota bacterium]|uniref:Arginine--tRNA ligase n=1 Tax=Candidatus Sungiibacteriota bacterium TaxID=2750080 RepID=A0A7T5UPK7_9BACT|nr:MAG: arginine--tRNA ligase [Candidatus Sungbacteria bacterium]